MLLTFDFSSNTPLYLQLRNQIVIGIAQGRLSPGEKLPTVRALAEESGVNMMTVSKAYQLLAKEGYIVTDRRNGAVISGGAVSGGISEERMEELELHLAELRLRGLSAEEILILCRQLLEGLKT